MQPKQPYASNSALEFLAICDRPRRTKRRPMPVPDLLYGFGSLGLSVIPSQSREKAALTGNRIRSCRCTAVRGSCDAAA